MRDTDDRVARVRSRQRALIVRSKRRNSLIVVASVALLACIPVLMVALGGKGAEPDALQTLFGASLFGDGMGGYVFVGIVSFAAAVAITLASLRYRKRRDEQSAIASGNDGNRQ